MSNNGKRTRQPQASNILDHLTFAQVIAAEDYLGVPIGEWERVRSARMLVVQAWARRLQTDPAATLGDVEGQPMSSARTADGGPPGEA